MKNEIKLLHFCADDAPLLRERQYPNLSLQDIENYIRRWNTFEHKGRYFEALKISLDGKTIGYLSLYEQTADVVSFGIEIYPPFQRRGYGTLALKKGITYAKKLGFSVAVAERLDKNEASRKLLENAAFVFERNYVNTKGRLVAYYSKPL